MAQKPNVLLILTDQQNIQCMGAYGNQDIRTPNLDELASQSVRFTNSFCPFPVCTPSRYSMMTGRYVFEHRGNGNQSTPIPEVVPFPRLMKYAGYRTAAVGKMHFTPTYLDIGFDEMILCEQHGEGRWDDDYHRELMKLGLHDENDLEDQVKEFRSEAPQSYWDSLGARTSNLPEEHHSTTWIGNRAGEFIQSWKGDGNLLKVSFVKPHHPFDPPKPWDEMYDPDSLELLSGWCDGVPDVDQGFRSGFFPNVEMQEKALRKALAYYYSCITQIDAQVGRLIDLLKSKNMYEDTMIIFTSDHGDFMGFHHMILKGNHMYDPLSKVPLLIKFPGAKTEGRVDERLVSNVDLAPTILSAVGIQKDSGMRGLDLGNSTNERNVVFAEAGNEYMARTKTRKLLFNVEKKKSLFFDLEKDPDEFDNLINDEFYQKEINGLEAEVLNWRGNMRFIRTYVDKGAQQIRKPNVPPQDDVTREKVKEYYRMKMQETK